MARYTLTAVTAVVACIGFSAPALAQSWVTFTNQTSTRLISDPSVGVSDGEEKDFAWGDFDQDGDVDLVCVRKEPFTTAGRRRNVLFMNEGIAQGQSINGVLVDRTLEYASAADDGGQGMLDLTCDRDVVVSDVNNDGWLDIITATTYGQGLPKTISHPRVYINLGEVNGVWQGFRYEQARIPTLPGAPNFCGVAAGDVTGDKAPDLYFVDYDSLTISVVDDRLLINDGNGFFTDQSDSRVTGGMLDSAFGTACHIVDMNGDGKLDIVKSENGPIKISYNTGGGYYNSYQLAYSGSAYFVGVGDINGDGKMDMVASDDGVDRYLLNTGVNGSNQATFNNLSFPANSTGFGSTSRFFDLNNDGFTDVIICDVDVDAPGCSRQTRLYRNLGNLPNVTMAEQGTGGIPAGTLQGCHDVAVIDLNGDGWKDLVLGKCTGIQVWMQTPPSGLIFTYPQGLPGFVPINQDFTFQVQVSSVGSITPVAGSGLLYYAINNGSFTSVPMTVISGNLYSATLPAVQCTNTIKFYVTAQASNATIYKDPAGAPNITYSAIAGVGTQNIMSQNFEGDASNWSVVNSPLLTAGAWEQAVPIGTVNSGSIAAPNEDAGQGDDVKAFITQNGVPGGAANASDVDGGPTYLLSPVLDLSNSDATISYARWFYCEDAGTPDGDFLTTEVSNNGGTNWVFVHKTGSTGGEWENTSFRVGDFVSPTNQVRVRFWTSDIPNNSVTEAGIDNFAVEKLICALPCPADVNHSGGVNVDDLLAVINNWGPCADPNNCPADIAPAGGNDVVDVDDLLAVINGWGPCP